MSLWRTVGYWLGLCPSEPIMFGEKPRDPKWQALEKAHLKIEPGCIFCGRRDGVEVHHVKPYHLYPREELDPANLATLCRKGGNHHLWEGHLGDFEKGYNLHVREQAQAYRQRVARRESGG